MLIAAFETTGRNASCALIDETGRLIVERSEEKMNHLKDIIVLLDRCFKIAGAAPGEFTHAAASVGPGSFTGIRIGVTTARTVAQAAGAKAIGISSLEGMALEASDCAREAGIEYIVPLINARRNQTYSAAYRLTDDGLKLVLKDRQYMIDELLNEVKGLGERVLLTGDGADSYLAVIEETLSDGSYELAPSEARYPSAGSIARLALSRLESAGGYEELLPDYMRLSEAEQRLKEGTLSKRIRGEL